MIVMIPSAPSAWMQPHQSKSPVLGLGEGGTWGGIPSACTAFLVPGLEPITPQCRTWFAQHPPRPYYAPDPWGGVVLQAPPGQIIQGVQIALTAPRPTTTGGGQTGASYWAGLGNAHFLQAGVSTETWGHTVQDDVWIQAWNPQGIIWFNQQSGAIAPGTPLQVVLRPIHANTQEQVRVIDRATHQVLLSTTAPLPLAGGWHQVEWIAEPLSNSNRWTHATQSLTVAAPSERVPFTGELEVAGHWQAVPTASHVPPHWAESSSVAALLASPLAASATPMFQGTITQTGRGVFWTPRQPAIMNRHHVYVKNSRPGGTAQWVAIAHHPRLTPWEQEAIATRDLGQSQYEIWPHRQWRSLPWGLRLWRILRAWWARL